MHSCLDLFASEAAQKGLTLTAEIADDLPRALLGDEATVKRLSRRNGEVCQQFGDPLRVKVV